MNKMRLMRACALAAIACTAARAGPTALDIDSLPVAANCKPATSAAAGTADGASLLRPAPLATWPASPSATPKAGSGDLYQATIDLANWAGHFSRYVLPAGAGGASAMAWDAGAILTGTQGRPPSPAPEQRQIYTAIVQPDGALMTIPFTWSTLSAAQQAALDLEDHAGAERLAYLRGDRTLEGAQFRRRGSLLGDAIHSTPVHAGSAVYLGANDGMLHAFDAGSGAELFAYIPDALIAQLHYLSDPAYVHRAYVDGPAGAGEALIGGDKKTILLSAMGGGARGVFALDITDPAHFADGLGALWEFTGRDDPMMGNVTTIPQIAKVRVKRDVYRYFAIVASGVNNGGDGKGALFLLALDKPRNAGWQLNSNYYRLITPIADATLANALSAPVLLNDSDGALRYAYGGDLQGNLWRFDVSGNAPWSKAVGQPLFVARDAGGGRQPITEQPLLAFANKGYMVLFGTGRLIERADRSAAITSPQSYYGIIDSLLTPPDVVTSRHQLTQRYLDGSGVLLGISGARMDVDSKGWYLDFMQPEERSIHAGVLADGVVLFNTVLPGADMCSPAPSRSYALNVLTGLPDDSSFATISPAREAIVGLLLPDYAPFPMVLPESVTRSAPDAAGRIRQDKTAAVVQVDSAGQLTAQGSMQTKRRVGRLSWREVSNWRELHEAAK